MAELSFGARRGARRRHRRGIVVTALDGITVIIGLLMWLVLRVAVSDAPMLIRVGGGSQRIWPPLDSNDPSLLAVLALVGVLAPIAALIVARGFRRGSRAVASAVSVLALVLSISWLIAALYQGLSNRPM